MKYLSKMQYKSDGQLLMTFKRSHKYGYGTLAVYFPGYAIIPS